MTLRDALLTQFDLEAAETRRTLERVPMNKPDWKPHERSMTLGWLATFLAVMWSWGNSILEKDEFEPDLTSGGKPELPKTTEQLLGMFDKITGAFRASLAATDDAALTKSWTLKLNDKPPLTQPKWLMIQAFILNHAVHHRGQLTVYLRLNGVPVPAIYNDSADEKGGIFRD
jgi:uncharacterized damage-inducible protein DinB